MSDVVDGLIEKRVFLKSLGAVFLSSFLPSKAIASVQSPTGRKAMLASAFMTKDRKFGLALLDDKGELVTLISLPARGHDLTVHRPTGTGVLFARRPGTFALAIDLNQQAPPVLFAPHPERHFYGHGVFSSDGKLLFSTENDFDNARGKIGIYDATNKFSRVGEFESYGVGPHDISLMPGGKTLIVANGGIETHPDYGRTKLNLSSMEPGICFVDAGSGDLLQRHKLRKEHHRVSLRHMADDGKQRIWIGGQYQGEQHGEVPLLYSLDPEKGLESIELPSDVLRSLSGYVGSIEYDHRQNRIGITSPTGGIFVSIDPGAPDKSQTTTMPKVCGLTATSSGFAASSHLGEWISGGQTLSKTNLLWDNHIAQL